jgi:hypothetical protein
LRIRSNIYRLTAATALLAACTSLFGQQVAFTLRGRLDCPIVISSFEQSKAFGFETVVLRNEGQRPITAVRLQITLQTETGEEIADERRVSVELQPRDTRRVAVDLGYVEGLRQKARSDRQEKALAILTLNSVEFEDGSSWQPNEPVKGIPDLNPPKPRK